MNGKDLRGHGFLDVAIDNELRSARSPFDAASKSDPRRPRESERIASERRLTLDEDVRAVLSRAVSERARPQWSRETEESGVLDKQPRA